VNASMEPAVAKTHQLSNDLAWDLIGDRVELKQVLPLKTTTVAVLTQEVAANNVQKPDIWEAREVTLTEADKLTPVNVAIWDSGSDLSLFTGRVYTDPHPGPQGDPHDLAFDLKGFPTHGYLLPLDGQQTEQYPGMRDELKGFSDLQLSIDSPEATAVKQKFASLSPADVPAFIEQLEFYSIYSHGTHVAGIAARGNPAIRLAVGRITFDWHNVPLPPSEELSQRAALGARSRAREAITARLASGDMCMESVAASLAMSVPTLRRRLEDEGTTFTDLVDDVRRDLAERYLREPDRSISEIAALLGFAHAPAFHKAFRRWKGVTPTAHRART